MLNKAGLFNAGLSYTVVTHGRLTIRKTQSVGDDKESPGMQASLNYKPRLNNLDQNIS